MKIHLRRFLFEEQTTIGYLSVDDNFECFTLEDIPRQSKIKGETCIPEGIYTIEIKQSPHFGRLMPYLTDVPGFTDIMIHYGNKKEDTLGCVLVGEGINSLGSITGSRTAFEKLFIKLQKADKIYISVEVYVPPIPE